VHHEALRELEFGQLSPLSWASITVPNFVPTNNPDELRRITMLIRSTACNIVTYRNSPLLAVFRATY
jgi:hypothetical protein